MDCKKIRLLIVDDHPLFRRGVRLFLDTVPGLEMQRIAAGGIIAGLTVHCYRDR